MPRRLSRARASIEDMALDDFEEALDVLIASDAANYGDCQSIEELRRLHSRVIAFVAEVKATFEAGEQ